MLLNWEIKWFFFPLLLFDRFKITTFATKLGVRSLAFLGSGILLLNYVAAILAAIFMPQVHILFLNLIFSIFLKFLLFFLHLFSIFNFLLLFPFFKSVYIFNLYRLSFFLYFFFNLKYIWKLYLKILVNFFKIKKRLNLKTCLALH